MYNIRQLTEDLFYVGCSDRRLALFESAYPIPNGISYNSYLLKDDKTVLFDTVDKSCAGRFFENLEASLNGRKLDYLVIHHMEPDHAALIEDLVKKYSEIKIICTQKASDMLKQFFCVDMAAKLIIVKEGDTLNTGNHELVFYAAPMVHWPEVMVTYDKTDKALFSADAFGSFGAVNGNICDNEVSVDEAYWAEVRRYYANIVGKYGTQVQMLLKKASALDIRTIYPLHGLVIKNNISNYLSRYNSWSAYKPEDKGVVIAYSSVYGGTENAMDILAGMLSKKGVKNIKMYDLSYTNPSYVLADAFKYSNIVLGTTTYNMGIFESMEHFLQILVSHNLQNRKYTIVENGSWAPTCGGQIREILEKLKGSEFISEKLCIKSTVKHEQISELQSIANAITDSLT